MMDGTATTRPVRILGVASPAAIGLLPKLTCPVCWPAYTVVLSSLGLGFVDYTPYLLPLTALFVTVSLFALAGTARRRRTSVPLLVGALAGAALMLGKFALESDAVTYAAIACFVIAPFLPLRRRARAACSDCQSLPTREISP